MKFKKKRNPAKYAAYHFLLMENAQLQLFIMANKKLLSGEFKHVFFSILFM